MKILRTLAPLLIVWLIVLVVLAVFSLCVRETVSISYTNEYIELYSHLKATETISVTLVTTDDTEVSIKRVIDVPKNEQMVLYVSDLDSTQFDSTATIISATICDSRFGYSLAEKIGWWIVVALISIVLAAVI